MASEALSRIVRLAEATRPLPEATCVRILQLAESLGVRVTLRSSPSAKNTHARLAYSSPPEIALYRRGGVEFSKSLKPEEEKLLRPRERFSVAHELGHWLAWRDLGIEPASEGHAYWEQEGLMNEFAQALLVPQALVNTWLRGCSFAGSVVHPMQLKRWADSCLVSEDVIASALCRAQPQMGVLRLELVTKPDKKAKVLKVRFSAGGASLALPKVHTHVKDERLLDLLNSKELGFAEEVSIRLRDGHETLLCLAWRRSDANSPRVVTGSYRLVVAPPVEPSRRQLHLPL